MKKVSLLLMMAYIASIGSCSKNQSLLSIANEDEEITSFGTLGKSIGLMQLQRTNWSSKTVTYTIKGGTSGLIFSGAQHKLNLNAAVVNYSTGKFVELKKPDGTSSSLDLTRGILLVNKKEFKLTRENIDQISPLDQEALFVLSALYAEIAIPSGRTPGESLSGKSPEALSYDTPALGPCSWTVINIGGTKGIAIDRTNREVAAFLSSHLDCRAVLTVSVGCVWEDFYCLATQEIQCMQYCIIS